MQFKVKNNSRDNLSNALRRAGYHFMGKTEKGQLNFIRALNQGFYPRFHLYAQEKKDEIEFSLHLDQKQPRYKGATAHNADYQGPQIEKEAERIKQLFK